MYNNSKNIILLVEGARTEVQLFKKIASCFPEFELNPDNILVYNTNLWALAKSLEKEFGEKWFLSDDVDFRVYLKSCYPELKEQKITDIFLVFDYERQDALFDREVLLQISQFFSDSIENGKLYVNFPMIEAFKHLTTKTLPDESYKERMCFNADIATYKEVVNREGKFQDIRRLDRNILQQMLFHNIRKSSYIQGGSYELDESETIEYAHTIDMLQIIKKQNDLSVPEGGSVYVLCTCFFFMIDYKSIWENANIS